MSDATADDTLRILAAHPSIRVGGAEWDSRERQIRTPLVKERPSWSSYPLERAASHEKACDVLEAEVYVLEAFGNSITGCGCSVAPGFWTSYVGVVQSGAMRGGVIVMSTREGVYDNGHCLVISSTTPPTTLRVGRRYNASLRANRDGTFAVLGSTEIPDDVRPFFPDDPKKSKAILEALNEYEAGWCKFGNSILGAIARFPTKEIPTLYWSKEFVELSNQIGMGDVGKTMEQQALAAKQRWDAHTVIDWSFANPDGGTMIDEFNPSDLWPGIAGVWFDVPPEGYPWQGVGDLAGTLLFVRKNKMLHHCNWQGVREVVAARIFINPNVPWNDTSDPNGRSFEWIATHETGHALGLSHRPGFCTSTQQIVNQDSYLVKELFPPKERSFEKIAVDPTPSPDDIERMNRLYTGEPATSPQLNCP